jgi:condensin complex subunit 2
MEKTPNGGNPLNEDTSAYRSYRRRQNQRTTKIIMKNTDAFESFAGAVEKVTNNKVNKINAFENRIIDLIDLIFTDFESNSSVESLWQKYSQGIEACGKIYGFCVDSIHSDTLSILQGLNRAGGQQELEEEQKQDKKKKKKIMGGVKSLVENPEEITTSKFERYEEFDAYFKTISSKFDAGNFRSLLINNISASNQLDLAFASDLPGVEDVEPTDAKITYPPIVLTENIPDISEVFGKFKDLPDISLNFIENFKSAEKNLDFERNSESEETGFQESADEIEFSFNEQPSGFNESFVDPASEDLAARISQISQIDDYKFFNKACSWAGFDYAKGIVCASSKITEKKPKARKEKKEDNFQLDPDFQFDLNTFFPNNKVAKNERSNNKTESLVKLPQDFGFTLKRFTRLFTRPKMFVKSIKSDDNRIKHAVVEGNFDSSDDNLEIDALDELQKPEFGSDVKFSVKSKQVDIKLLKETMKDRINGTKSFLTILDEIPVSIPKSELDQLSIHSCFITILHLANENNLELVKTGPCDFSISKFK